MKVQLRFGYVWGEKSQYLGPNEYKYALDTGVESLRFKRVEMDVHIKTHPRFMDEWVDFLVSRSYPVPSFLDSCSVLSVECLSPFKLVLPSTGSHSESSTS